MDGVRFPYGVGAEGPVRTWASQIDAGTPLSWRYRTLTMAMLRPLGGHSAVLSGMPLFSKADIYEHRNSAEARHTRQSGEGVPENRCFWMRRQRRPGMAETMGSRWVEARGICQHCLPDHSPETRYMGSYPESRLSEWIPKQRKPVRSAPFGRLSTISQKRPFFGSLARGGSAPPTASARPTWPDACESSPGSC